MALELASRERRATNTPLPSKAGQELHHWAPGATSTPPHSHTETLSRYSSGPPSPTGRVASRQPRLQIGHHWPPGGRNARHWPAAPVSPQQASAPSGLSCNYHRPEPERLTRKTLAGLGSDPPLQDHARTQLQGPRDHGNRLILPQVKPKPQDNAAPRPPRHQRGT